MLRYILYLLLIYFGWRIIKTIFTIKYRSSQSDENVPPFDKIQEAEFEDITNKPEVETQQKGDNISDKNTKDSTE